LEADNDKPHLKSEPLGSHDRAAFSCGTPELDAYLKTRASQEIKKHLAAVFVLTPDSKTIAGFYTLSQYSVGLDEIPAAISRKLTRYNEVPATLVGRLARSVEYRGKGIGEKLILDALRRCLVNSREIASWAVIVDAKDETALAFYRKFGFAQFPNTPNRLFLPIVTIEDMFS
jgi:ribosomal protein S18 acetylase RimI-like enzyme